MKKNIIIILSVILLFSFISCDRDKVEITLESSWDEILEAAKDTQVNLYMWGGDPQINKFIEELIANNLKDKYNLKLNMIPVDNIRDTLNQILVEKNAGKKDGNTDVFWINGENFKFAKDNELLWGEFVQKLPSVHNYVSESSLKYDFGEPVENLEAPWGEAQFVYVYDSDKVANPPTTIEQLRKWVKENPGMFTYPAPPDFIGSTFVRQIIIELSGGSEIHLQGLSDEQLSANMEKAWEFLNEIEPYLWREGETYPETSGRMHSLYSNGEILITMDYNPSVAALKVNAGEFPPSSRTFLFDNGTLFNNHYLSIPFNAPNKAGALVLINYLLSPEAQLAKADPINWGDGTVLDMNKLDDDFVNKFQSLKVHPSLLSFEEMAEKRIPEIPARFVELFEKEWYEKVAVK